MAASTVCSLSNSVKADVFGIMVHFTASKLLVFHFLICWVRLHNLSLDFIEGFCCWAIYEDDVYNALTMCCHSVLGTSSFLNSY